MTLFGTNKKETTILDCFTYDLKTFFYDEYEEVASEETPATVMIVYQKKLPWVELEVFDVVQFRIFFDKESLTGSNPVNVRFISSENKAGVNNAKAIINKVFTIYGPDNYNLTEWCDNDIEAYNNLRLRRVWTIDKGESFISIENNQDNGLSLNILFFNNMLKESKLDE
jgi:hypothetical protein